jgi:subtilase family serine protease
MESKRSESLHRAVLAGFLACTGASPLSGGPPARIHDDLQNGQAFVLAGNAHPLIASAVDQGEVEGSFPLPRIAIHFKMTAAQQTELNRLLDAQQEPSSPQYHKWLTPEQYADRFGVSESDLNRITAWLQRMGLNNIQVARSRTFVSMSGTAAQVRYAFQTTIHRYRVNGSPHYAESTDAVLPAELDGMVSGIRGLNDFHPRAHVRLRSFAGTQPRFTSSLTGNHFLAPDDFATIYNVRSLYASGIDGTGQGIAIAGQTDILLSDIEAFQAASGLPLKDPQIVLDGADPGSDPGDQSEADLDIEWAGAVARGATIIYVNSQDVFTSATYAIDNNLAPVLSITYGACAAQFPPAEINTLNSVFAQANAQGITVVAASGDLGAADCDAPLNPNAQPPFVATHGLAVDFPASSPYVTAVGGTAFNEGSGNYWSSTNNSNGGSALSYIPEMAWNDTVADHALSATGGGASSMFSKPSWQQGTSVPNDGFRDVPDIALSASADHDGYLICSGGRCTNGFRDAQSLFDVVGGTSCGAPTFAGIVALINQQTNGSQGNVNAELYSLASISSDAFHDVTAGNNQVSCRTGTPNCSTGTMGYVAGPGYDQVTGLGSVDAYNLVNEWTSDFQIAVNPTSLTVPAGGSSTADVQVTRFANFAGTVSFTCSVPSVLTNTTCSIPGTVSGSGSVTLTITNSSAAGSAHGFPFRNFPHPGGSASPWGAALLVAAASGLLLFRRSRVRAVWGGVAALSLAMIAGCGQGPASSNVSQPSSATGNVTVTSTCGVLRRTTTISVTVP